MTIFPPDMLVSEKVLAHWMDNFYGYGSWRAKFWFVSHEEGGGELPEEVSEKLEYFQRVHQAEPGGVLCDIRDLYKHVAIRWDSPATSDFKTLYEYRFGSNATVNNLWKNIIAFIHGYEGVSIPEPSEYQRNKLVSPALRNEAFIRLYPLPAPHSHSWYYSWLDAPTFPFLKSRDSYQKHFYNTRISTLVQNLKKSSPQVVLMYGMSNISAIKESVKSAFPGATFKQIKATKREIPQHHRVELNDTLLLITTQIPALRHNRIETGFDWYKFGGLVK